ncbi:MAG: SusC/RagA family TonB-linked outer membrane protein [Gemmatimonadaceae bacterium]|nr:SusC/RagA family TonB-linked outer membrane protein [Gemmatimonadaceae bacterium]
MRVVRGGRLAAALLALASSLCLSGAAQAQGAVITGTVTDDGNVPLQGAQVMIESMTISVGTDALGKYTMNIPASRVTGQQVVLRVRSIGFTPQTVQITLSAGRQTHDFKLAVDVNRLSQVVITGVTAGTEQKKLPFTVAQVSASDMPVPAMNPTQALQGKVPGFYTATSNGRPGADLAVMIRTPNSIIGSTSPLYIVDGVIATQGIGSIDPLDIESVEVIKGASASTLYGSRAASGVIQITTKAGKTSTDGVKFSTRAEYGASDIEGAYRPALTNFLTMDETRTRYCAKTGATSTSTAAVGVQDCMQTLDLYQEALRVNEQSGTTIISPTKILTDGGIALTPPKQNLRGLFQVNLWPVTYDVVRQALTTGPYLNATVDMQGRFGASNYFASLSDLRQRGSVVFVDGYHRNNVRVNVDNTFGGDWTLSLRNYYARTQQFTGGTDFFSLTRQPPFVDLLRRDKYGRLFVRSVVTDQGNQNTNPAYSWEQANSVTDGDRYTGSMLLRWQPAPWMTSSFNFGFDRSNSGSAGQTNIGYRITTNSSPSTPLGSGSISNSSGQSYNANWDWTFRKDELVPKLNSRLVLLAVYEQRDNNSNSQSGAQFVAPGLTTTNALITNFNIGSGSSSQRSVGLVANANFEYRDRYILDVSGRRDGLSTFGVSHRWQGYGKASMAWRMSEERWWPLARQVNELKLRASTGQAGNTPGASWQYETFSIGTGGTLNPSTLGNRNLAPEVATETEIGIDAELFHRYGLTISRAHTITNNIILQVTPPAAAGFSSQYKNVGTLDGTTVEVSLSVPIIEKRDLSWSMRLNYDASRSMVSKLNVPDFFSGLFFYSAGEPIGRVWGRRFTTRCDELPYAYRDRCGDGKEWQRNDDGLIVWVGPGGRTWKDGITTNAWQAVLPASQAPYGVEESWGMPIIMRDTTSTATAKPVLKLPVGGKSIPDFRWSIAQQGTWKRLSFYALVDAIRGRAVYNQEKQWSLGDFAYHDVSQLGKSVETAKPIGYYWRVGAPDASGVGGWYDVIGPNNISVEDGSFVKIREVSLSYRVGRVWGVGNWMATIQGRNLKTFTRYTGFDPDISSGSVLNANDAYNFPPLRTMTFTISTTW